jgi:hypothetical protein
MAFRTRNTKLWASRLPEAVYNVPWASGADFDALVSQNPFYLLPSILKTSDAGQIGTGSHFATLHCNDYWSQPQVGLGTNQALFDMYGRMWLRAFGGAVTDTVTGTGNEHKSKLQSEADGSQLPGTSMVVENGPEKVLESGMVVAEAVLSKTRADAPSLNLSLFGTGNHVNQHTLTGLPPYTPSGVCPKSGIRVVYTNPDSTVVDLGAAGCSFVDLSVSLNNNLQLNDRCPSDPELTMPVVDGGTANTVTRVLRAEQSLDIGFTFLLETTNPEYTLHLTNERCTNLIIAVLGPVIGAGPQTYAIGVGVPKFRFVTVGPTDNNGNAAYSSGVGIEVDSTPADLPFGFVVNETVSNFK